MNCLYRLISNVRHPLHRIGMPMKYLRSAYSDTAECVEIPSVPSFLKLPPKLNEIKQQKYDYFLVLDFEATCDSPVNAVPQEIIEFPVLKVNAKTFETESEFHSYVRPVINPQLSKFCIELTGITQEIVDNSLVFEDVFQDYQNWLHKEGLLKPGVKLTCATCGDWDLRFMLPMQCKGLRLPVPDFMKRWINVKVSFAELTDTYPRNMMTMIKYCQLQHEGRLHSGIDDCRNIARVLKNLAERGMVFECNGKGNGN
ncbi:ERI1 exoribonuclease 3-like [Stegodyphus dumicola]|uniref:ERI1 exoribonuclease 3-like n=1 Tax=Stegodyphus dumicola TaxID=202533 RepID=UPI0015A82AF0|nr:ERI1 exoribonuclease 3-like [Stegodyphus dumicola]